MERTLYVIASSPDIADSIAFLSRNEPDDYELSASTPEDAARALAELRAKPGRHRTDWLAKASVYEVTTLISPVT